VDELDKVGLLVGQQEGGEYVGEEGELAAYERRGDQDVVDGVDDAVLGFL
jgi:hypothetical protein